MTSLHQLSAESASRVKEKVFYYIESRKHEGKKGMYSNMSSAILVHLKLFLDQR